MDDASLLRANGLKATPARAVVLALLQKTRKPLSIAAIHKRLKNSAIDLVTVYRTMASFEGKGLIRQVDLRHGHAHYELATADVAHHHHLICENCGKIVDISQCDTSGLEKQALKIGGFAKLTKHSLEFFGLCKTCARKNKKRLLS